MNSKLFREAELSYYAIYDQDLREEMEELGLISDVDEERAPGVNPYNPGPTGAQVRANAAAAERRKSGKDKPGWKDRTGKTEGPLITVNPGNPEDAKKVFHRTRQRPHSRTGNPARIMGGDIGKGSTRGGAATLDIVKGSKRNIARANRLPEEYDIYDIILSHLIDEGYAATVENAEAIMVNMSEEWISSIVD